MCPNYLAQGYQGLYVKQANKKKSSQNITALCQTDTLIKQHHAFHVAKVNPLKSRVC